MKRVLPEEVINLDNAVAPVAFAVRDGHIFYFDRINKYEGRFCKLGNRGEYLETEVDESQGVLTHDGDEFLLNINNNYTRIERLLKENEWQELIKLEGIFFDIKRNQRDMYVCLGNFNSETIIKIFDEEGRVINEIRPENIIFGSSLYLQGEYIYLTVIDNNNNFKILKLDYSGNIEVLWDMDINSGNRIIVKISIYYNYIVMLTEGRGNSLILLDRVDGSIKEIFSGSFGVNNITDFDIYEDNIYILNGKCIYRLKCRDLTLLEGGKSSIDLRPNLEFLYYRYHIYSKGLRDEIIFSLLSSIFITIAVFVFLKNKYMEYINGYDLLIILCCFYVITAYFIASTKNIFRMGKKESRIEYLLSSCREFKFKNELMVPLFFGATAFAMVELGMYPEWNFVLPFMLLILTSSVFYGIEYLCIKKIKAINKDMVVELLEDSDTQTTDYIKRVVSDLKQVNVENLSIEIVSGRKIKKKYLERWKSTRNYILGKNIIVRLEDNKIITEMDLSKRDIKYSRFSIIMDYVCFIKSLGEIKEIQVEYAKKQV